MAAGNQALLMTLSLGWGGEGSGLPLSLSRLFIMHTPFLLSFLLFLPTYTIFHFLSTSVPASCGPPALFGYWVFLSLSPTLAPHSLVLNGGFWTLQWSEERPFLHRPSLSNNPPEPPALLYLLLCSLFTFLSQLSLSYHSHHAQQPHFTNFLSFINSLFPLTITLCVMIYECFE